MTFGETVIPAATCMKLRRWGNEEKEEKKMEKREKREEEKKKKEKKEKGGIQKKENILVWTTRGREGPIVLCRCAGHPQKKHARRASPR